ncbi:asparagine--tRNA ligase SLM5 SCDLUD_003406 [Saccharomycodes ludwigii]|uniref:asparagine--tRNA ligase SLM5 n=1 Tax=Saccharomycodes ludwigii TaxID=36035 RepID=UPI001E8961E9|nr:hypothetical protein SCDLUD_003406 [Saccharomycodes ludwigii]KAH3900426.1 hypothetical protein SCDLUD_003406 [Saccharomycodes ludwigii]
MPTLTTIKNLFVQAKNISKPTILNNTQVNGWVKSVRNLKHITFVDISDGTTSSNLKIVIPKLQNISPLKMGESVKIINPELIPTANKREQLFEVKIHNGGSDSNDNNLSQLIKLGSIDPATYPLQKKQLGLNYLRNTAPQYKFKTDYLSSMMRFRSFIELQIFKTMDEMGYIKVSPPIITGSDCEGAGELFELLPRGYFKKTSAPISQGTPALSNSYLTVSTQLHLEVLAQSLSSVYTLTPCFRAEKSDTNRHLSEFWMMELETCFIEDIHELCGITQSILKEVIKNCIPHYEELLPNMKPLDIDGGSTKMDKKKILDSWENLVKNKWPIVTYTEVINILNRKIKESKVQFFKYNNGKEVQWGDDIHSEYEKWLAGEYFASPVFVIDYPKNIKAFYMKQNTPDNKTVSCFDLLVPEIGEIVGGSMREDRYDVLLKEMEARGMSSNSDPSLKWYLDLRMNGTVPHGGFGLGIERFVTYLFGGHNNIKDAIPFYRVANGPIDI